jgi:hypothetical protein
MALLGDIKIMMLKGEKGDKGDGSYDDTEIRGMIAQETAYREEEIAEMERNFLNYLYPVGSIYMTVGTTSPAVLFGGTWEHIENCFLYSGDDIFSVGDTGGSAETEITYKGTVEKHYLTANEIPAHTHEIGTTGIQRGNSGEWGTGITAVGSGIAYSPSSVGGSQGHSHQFSGDTETFTNMPPFLTVNMWKRTA